MSRETVCIGEMTLLAEPSFRLKHQQVVQIKHFQSQVVFPQERLLSMETDREEIEIKAPSPRWQEFLKR